MNKVETLDFVISEKKVNYFTLKNNNMGIKLYIELINMFTKRSNASDGKKADSFLRAEENGEVVLHVIQKKVPNVIKYLVNSNDIDINVNLTGIKPNREIETRTITKPFDKNKVLELVPCYHPTKTIETSKR